MTNSEQKQKLFDALAECCKKAKQTAVENVKLMLEELFSERQELQDGVESLRKQLYEIHLLNAKMLYSSKAMKGRNFTPEQKVAVIEDFDKANTVAEVKEIFVKLYKEPIDITELILSLEAEINKDEGDEWKKEK